ncbi:MAG TPA: hypothetical protein VD993_15705 [Chitinophagaceae bacterium]|nr:hypothetical protein [Chitinophagaceae bacterium]
MAQQSPLTVRWNKLALSAIKYCKTSPPLAARMLAMLHTAMYDAWSVYDKPAISTTTARLIKRYRDCEDDDMPKAISYAAFRVLTHCFWVTLPAEHRNMFRELMYECKYDPDDCSYDTSSPQGIGNLIAKLVNECRRGDESNQDGIYYYAAPWFDFTGYQPKNPPVPAHVKDVNYWQPLQGSDGKPQDFLAAHWALVKPFALTHAWQFRPDPPFNTTDNPGEFRRQAEEVFAVSQQLTPLQKAIAEYWADGSGTVTPPGHWCEIAQYISDTNCKDYSEEQCVKLFFALSNALLDASIACWDSKRKYDSARPISVIRSLLRRNDWNSYIPTPPFPEHVSGHSSFSKAAAVILKNFTGSDEFGAVGVLEKGTSVMEPGKPDEDIELPAWKTFTDAAEQAAMSRLYGGIHFRRGNQDGLKLGEQVGNQVWEKALFYFNDK